MPDFDSKKWDKTISADGTMALAEHSCFAFNFYNQIVTSYDFCDAPAFFGERNCALAKR